MGYTFDEQGVRRIVATVRRVEQDPGSLTGKSIPIASGTSINWLPGYNNAGEEIPAYSCVIIGAKADKDGVEYNALTKPTTAFTTAFGLTAGVDSESGDQLGYHVESGFAKYKPAPQQLAKYGDRNQISSRCRKTIPAFSV